VHSPLLLENTNFLKNIILGFFITTPLQGASVQSLISLQEDAITVPTIDLTFSLVGNFSKLLA